MNQSDGFKRRKNQDARVENKNNLKDELDKQIRIAKKGHPNFKHYHGIFK